MKLNILSNTATFISFQRKIGFHLNRGYARQKLALKPCTLSLGKQLLGYNEINQIYNALG